MILKLIIIEPSKEVNKSFLSFSKKVHPKSKSVGFKKKKKEKKKKKKKSKSVD